MKEGENRLNHCGTEKGKEKIGGENKKYKWEVSEGFENEKKYQLTRKHSESVFECIPMPVTLSLKSE